MRGGFGGRRGWISATGGDAAGGGFRGRRLRCLRVERARAGGAPSRTRRRAPGSASTPPFARPTPRALGASPRRRGSGPIPSSIARGTPRSRASCRAGCFLVVMRLVRSAGSTGKKRCRRSPSARLASGPALERPREFGAFRRTRSEREAHPARCAVGYAWPRGFRESEGDSPLGISRGFSPGDRRRRLDGEKCRRLAIKRVLARSNPPRRRRSPSRRHTPAPRVAPLVAIVRALRAGFTADPASRTRPRPRRGFPLAARRSPGSGGHAEAAPSFAAPVASRPTPRAARGVMAATGAVWIPAVGLAALDVRTWAPPPLVPPAPRPASRAPRVAPSRRRRRRRCRDVPDLAPGTLVPPRGPATALFAPRDLSRAPRHRRLVASAATGGGDGDEGDDDAPLSSEETARLDAEAAEFASDWAAELSAAAWTDAGEAPEGDRSSDEASQVRERESNDPVTEPVTDARRKGARATRRKRATPPPRVLT